MDIRLVIATPNATTGVVETCAKTLANRQSIQLTDQVSGIEYAIDVILGATTTIHSRPGAVAKWYKIRWLVGSFGYTFRAANKLLTDYPALNDTSVFVTLRRVVWAIKSRRGSVRAIVRKLPLVLSADVVPTGEAATTT